MASGTSCDRDLLVDALTKGKELMKQLEAHLDEASVRALAEKIEAAFTTAISIAKSITHEGSRQPAGPSNMGSESPRSASLSPRSDNSDSPFIDNERKETSKKRKTLPKWTSRVRICAGTGIEGPHDDGYSWRKYGQKDILGAKYPRGYYRCTHRKAQGCNAKKQVQRTDEDPSVFDVTYQSNHTCLQSPRPVQTQRNRTEFAPNQDWNLRDKQLSFRTSLDEKTEGLGTGPMTSLFSFPCIEPKGITFTSLSMLDHHHNLMGSFPPPIVSTTASEPEHYYLSAHHTGSNPQALKSEVGDVGSTSCSMLDMDLELEIMEMNPDYHFDDSNNFLS